MSLALRKGGCGARRVILWCYMLPSLQLLLLQRATPKQHFGLSHDDFNHGGGAVAKQFHSFVVFLILYFAPGLNEDITTLCKH